MVLMMFDVLAVKSEAVIVESGVLVASGILILLASIGITIALTDTFDTQDLVDYLYARWQEFKTRSTIAANLIWACIQRIVQLGKTTVSNEEINALQEYVEYEDTAIIEGAPTFTNYECIRAENGYYLYKPIDGKIVTNPWESALTMPFSDSLVTFDWIDGGMYAHIHYQSDRDWTGSYIKSSNIVLDRDYQYKVRARVELEEIDISEGWINYIKINKNEGNVSGYWDSAPISRTGVTMERIISEGTKTQGETIQPRFYFSSNYLDGFAKMNIYWEILLKPISGSLPTTIPYSIVKPETPVTVGSDEVLKVKEELTEETAETVINNYIYNNQQPEVIRSLLPVAYAVTAYPLKMVYNVGDSFVPTGLVIQAVYSDNSTELLYPSDLLWAPSGALTEDDETVSFYYNGALAGTIPITINRAVDNVEDVPVEDYPGPPEEGSEEETSLKALFFSKFPFCLPYDIYYAFKLIAADPDAPRFEIDLMTPFKDRISFFGDTKIVIDFDDYPILGQVSRWGFTISFCLVLIAITRKITNS